MRKTPLRRRTPLRARPRVKKPQKPRPGLPLDPGPGWVRLCQKILARDAHLCRYCGAADRPVAVDHILPRRLFLTTTAANAEENLCALCEIHHGVKTHRVEARLFRKGDPAPLYRWLHILATTGPTPASPLVGRALARLNDLLQEAHDGD